MCVVYFKGGIPGADFAEQLLEAVRAKKDIDDLQAILNTVPANATGQEDLNQDGNEKFLTLCLK